MKKVLSLLVALVMAFGISTAAFAATDDVYFGDSPRDFTRSVYGTSPDQVALAANELLIVDANRNIIGPEYHLKPGEEYEFKIYKSNQTYTSVDPAAGVADISPVTAGMLGGGKFRLRAVKGTSTISSAKIEKKGSGVNATYNLIITTRENWGTKMTDVEYNLTTIDQTAATAVAFETGSLTFRAGYGQFSDDDINEFSEGDIITITNDKPVILKKQFTTLAKNYNYKNVQFEAENGSWTYIGKVSGMNDTNFTYTEDVIPAIATKFADQDFKFLTFGAGVTFPTTGEMRIDVSDVSDDFTRMYTYLYRNGTLTPVSTTYDSGADEIVFRTNFLGSFVMTNEEITDTTILQQPNTVPTPAPTVPTTPTTPNIHNPSTGAGQGVALATTLGVVSLAAAAVVSRKKK